MKFTDQATTRIFEFVNKIYSDLISHEIILIYQGEINQAITNTFSSIAEKSIEKESDSVRTKMRVFHVMVECLQNICRHSELDENSSYEEDAGEGIFVVSKTDETYVITSGNRILTEKVSGLTDQVDKINSMEQDALKAYYKETIKNNRLSDKSGAGLGLIDMVKKTGNKIQYEVTKLNDTQSFLLQGYTVNRMKD